MYLLKIGFSRITPANLNGLTGICIGQSQILCVKILVPWVKGAQNGGEMVGVSFVTGTMNSHFFVTGQIGMKFGQKRQSVSSIGS